jgi:guanylate kinase
MAHPQFWSKPLVKKRLSEFHVGNFDDSNLPHIDGLQRRGMLLVISAPSGCGKSTMAHELLTTDPDVHRSVSATTRKPRGAEVDGVDYHFISHDRFKEMIEQGELLEWTQVYENYYGTPKKPVDEALAEGKDVLFAIDNHGARQIGEISRKDLVSVFILPPSMEELERRLVSRGLDSAESVRVRMNTLELEIEYYRDYDYVIINRDLEDSMLKLRTILGAERMKRNRLHGLEGFSERLQTELQDRRTKTG